MNLDPTRPPQDAAKTVAKAAAKPAALLTYPGDTAERVFDWTMAVGAVLVLGISFYFTPGTLPGIELCSFKRMTGLPCPGCGMTRAFCCISHLDFARAWTLNPFVYVFYGLTLYFATRLGLKRWFPNWEKRFMDSRWSTVLPLSLALGMLVFGLLRICLSPHSA